MKKLFNRFGLTLAATGLFLIAGSASAQQVQLYPLLMGGNTRVLANTNIVALGLSSTNTYGMPGTPTNLAIYVGNFDYVGFTWQFNGGSNNTLQAFASYDNGLTYNTNSVFASYSTPTAIAGWTTNASLDVHGVSTLAFVLMNKGLVDDTNVLLEINPKPGTTWTKPATQ